MRVAAAFLAAALVAGGARGHGHPAAIDEANPEAWKYRLCGEMAGVAIQALKDRERGRPARVYPDDGGPGPAIANAIVRKVYDEPGISSPKRAETFGRAHCNEALAGRTAP